MWVNVYEKCTCAHKVANVFQWYVCVMERSFLMCMCLSNILSNLSYQPTTRKKKKTEGKGFFFTPINLLEKDLVVIDTNFPRENPVRRKHTEKKSYVPFSTEHCTLKMTCPRGRVHHQNAMRISP